MIGPELTAEILRLHHAEKWTVGTIAVQLNVHHSVVERVIEQEGKRKAPQRSRMIDPFLPFILETLGKYPRLCASRLHTMVSDRGYRGKEGQFRALIAKLRPTSTAEAYLKLATLPGEQMQVDWAHFGRIQVGAASRLLMAFVLVLAYSRAIFLRFFYGPSFSNFLFGHQLAFPWLGGVPRKALYDNLKSVVLERIGTAIRFNPLFLQFAGHYRFEPRPVAIGRGNEKGRVERAIRYMRTSFFPARRYRDLDDLNRQARAWCEGLAMERRWPEDHRRTVGEVFKEEQQRLLALPGDCFPCEDRVEVSIGKYPYARYDLNDYSVPHTCAQRSLVVVASLDRVRILDGDDVVAEHIRSYDRAQCIEDPRHIEALVQEKAAAGQHHRTGALAQTVPSARALLKEIADRGTPLTRATKQLVELRHVYGAATLEAAIGEALRASTPHLAAVQHILERNRRAAGKPPARPLLLPDDPRVRDMDMAPPDLSSYDKIKEQTDGQDDR